jgi:hypothetical protein
MKKLLVLFALVCVQVDLFAAGLRVDAKVWSKLQKIDVATLSKDMAGSTGQIVELHFYFRGKDIHHLKPGWYESSLWQPAADGKGFSNVPVMVAKQDLAPFKALPTSGNTEELVVYGRVLRDNEAKFMFVRLMGRNAAPEAKGKVTVTW